MVNDATEAEVLDSERSHQTDRVIASDGPFIAVEMDMTVEKVQWMWTEMCKYRTLFSDLTRGSAENFTALITDPTSFWIEVWNEKELCGLMYFTNMQWKIDCEAHLVFFDRKPREKAMLCRLVAKWMFDNFPLNRITATVPHIYHYTLRLTAAIGFTQEGIKRQSQLMGNQWVDEIIFGLLRSEVG